MVAVTGAEVMTGFNIYWKIAMWVVVSGVAMFFLMFVITKVKENLRDNKYERNQKK